MLKMMCIMVVVLGLCACSDEMQEIEDNITKNLDKSVREVLDESVQQFKEDVNESMQQLKKELDNTGVSDVIKNFLDSNTSSDDANGNDGNGRMRNTI